MCFHGFGTFPCSFSHFLFACLRVSSPNSATKDVDVHMGGASNDTYSDDGDWGWGDDDNDDDDQKVSQVELGSWNSPSPVAQRRNHGFSSPPLHQRSFESGSGSSSRRDSRSPPTRSPSPLGKKSPPTAAPKGMKLNPHHEPLISMPPSTSVASSTTVPVLQPRKPPAPAPAENDIFAELGLAAHPTFSHHSPAAVTQAPATITSQKAAPASAPSAAARPGMSSSSPWRTATTTTTTKPKATTTATKLTNSSTSAAAAGAFDDDDGFGDDDWDDGDLDDLLND